jgi:hypothetical protein
MKLGSIFKWAKKQHDWFFDSDAVNYTMAGLMGAIILIIVLMSIFSIQDRGYTYKIEIGAKSYHCNEYKIEFEKLYLFDCSLGDFIIREPASYIIAEQ